MKSQSEFYKFNNNLKQLNDIVETTERNFYQVFYLYLKRQSCYLNLNDYLFLS